MRANEVGAAFYEGFARYPTRSAVRSPRRTRGCWFEPGTLRVHLGVDANFRRATKAHPAFIVAGIRALAREIAAARCQVADDKPLEGYDRVYVHDPCGNRIELIQPLT